MGRDDGCQHVFRQDQHHRAGAAIHRCGKCARHVFGDAPRVVDALDPLGHAAGGRPEEAQEVDLLEGLAVACVAGHIANEQNHRRAVLKRGVHADGRIGGAGAARHKTDAGAVAEFAVRLGHVGRAAFLPVDDELDFVGVKVKTVQHREVTFARHAKSVGHALGDQAFDQ